MGDFENAESLCRKAVEYATKDGHPVALSNAEMQYGIYFFYKREGKHAIEHIERCIEQAEKAGFEILVAQAQSLLGWAHNYLGEFERADEFACRGIEMSMQRGIEPQVPSMYLLRSLAQFFLGNEGKALRLIEEAVRLAKKMVKHFSKAHHAPIGEE